MLKISNKIKTRDGWSNNHYELNAILSAIRCINDHDRFSSKKIIVFTDSAAAKCAIENGILNRKSGWWNEIVSQFMLKHWSLFEEGNPFGILVFVKHYHKKNHQPTYQRIMKWCDVQSRSDISFLKYVSSFS